MPAGFYGDDRFRADAKRVAIAPRAIRQRRFAAPGGNINVIRFHEADPAQVPWNAIALVSLSVIDFDGPAHAPDGTLNGIGGSHPSGPGHFLNGAEARVTNVAVIGCRARAQHNRTPGGDEAHGLSTRHLGRCRPLLGHGACGEAHHEKGEEDRLQSRAPL